MSQENQKIRHLSSCHAATEEAPEVAAVISASSSDVSLNQRKEEARKILYLRRI